MKQFHKVILSLFFIVAVMVFSSSANATLYMHYQSPNLAGIDGNTWNDTQGASPRGQTKCFASGWGSNVFQYNIASWKAADFTGFSVGDTNLGTYQRGPEANGYGSTACQVKGTQMGFMQNSSNATQLGPTNNRGMQMLYSFPDDNTRPWKGYGPNASLRVQADSQVTKRFIGNNSVVQYSMIVVSLADTKNQRSFWYAIGTSDTRNGKNGYKCTENIHPDDVTTNINIDTCFEPNQKYVTMLSNSQNTTQNAPNAHAPYYYAARITRQNLINAANYANAHTGRVYSTNPDDYAVNGAMVNFETYVPPGTSSWWGGWARNLMVMTEN